MDIPERASVGEVYTHKGGSYEVVAVVGDRAFLVKLCNGWKGDVKTTFFHWYKEAYTVTRKIMENV